MAGSACKFTCPHHRAHSIHQILKTINVAGVYRCNLFTATQIFRVPYILANSLEEFKKPSECTVMGGVGRNGTKPLGSLQSQAYSTFGLYKAKLMLIAVQDADESTHFSKLQMLNINRVYLNIFNIFTLVDTFIKGFLFWKHLLQKSFIKLPPNLCDLERLKHCCLHVKPSIFVAFLAFVNKSQD